MTQILLLPRDQLACWPEMAHVIAGSQRYLYGDAPPARPAPVPVPTTLRWPVLLAAAGLCRALFGSAG